jgi:hypothetical protein
MRITLNCLFALSACILLASCSTVGELKGATSRFEELKAAGKLPGIAAADHGKLQSQAFPITHQVAYPASVGIYATKENDQSRYTYTLTKDGASSEWRLTAAWRTSPDGNREDLIIK